MHEHKCPECGATYECDNPDHTEGYPLECPDCLIDGLPAWWFRE